MYLNNRFSTEQNRNYGNLNLSRPDGTAGESGGGGVGSVLSVSTTHFFPPRSWPVYM